jgi:hypothetical protein
MSTSLYWRLVPKPAEHGLSNELKYRISKRLWDHDGTLGSGWTTIGPEWLPYLQGLLDGAEGQALKTDVLTIIEMITTHGEIELATLR